MPIAPHPVPRLPPLAALVLLAAVAPLRAEPDPVPQAAETPKAPPQSEATPVAQAQGLDEDLVYAVLVAELAGRRGDLDLAFTHYLHAAQIAKDVKMAELAVRSAIASEDPAAAERAVSLWLKLAPDAIGPHQVAALLRIDAGDREGALIELSRILEVAGMDGGSGYAQVVTIVGRAKGHDERIALMQALVERDAANPEVHQALASVAAAAGKSDLAESAARRALELKPDWSKPRIFLVRLLLSQDKRDQARSMLEGYVAESPDDRALLMLYGQVLVEAKELGQARQQFEHLLADQPKEPDVLFAVGVLSLQLEDLDAARDYFARLYRTGDRRDEAAFYLGQVEERAKRVDEAIDWYAKAGGENESDAQVRIALLRAKGGDVGRAREMVQQLRDRAPESAETLYMVEAEILDEVGLKDQALEVFDSALGAFPDHPELLYARAMYAVRIDRLERTEQDLRRLLDEDPNHADALNALGYTLADRTERYGEALELIERAHRLKPDEPAILDSMGWVHYRLGHLDVALDYLRRALAGLEDGEIAAHLGEVLWVMGRHDEAWEVWDSALKSHPEHAYLLKVVGRYRVTQSEPEPEPAR